MTPNRLIRRIRVMLIFFMVALALSGITAFPVYSELRWWMNGGYRLPGPKGQEWLTTVWKGVDHTEQHYPFLFYGFDWLAFAHLVIAMLFIGPYRDPVRNKWVIEWAMLTCVAILLLAFIAGPIRGIPFFHIVADCFFGILGLIPLGIVLRWIRQLELITK